MLFLIFLASSVVECGAGHMDPSKWFGTGLMDGDDKMRFA